MNTAQTFEFKTEARQLLDLMIHSLYSNKEVFLRELVSNASDALDRRRFEALTQAELLPGDTTLEVRIEADPTARTLRIADSGIGMSRDELVTNLGTIAHSGTKAFSEKLKEAKTDAQMQALIGQFGVGFYSSFMVSERVEVVTRRAGSDEAWRFESAGDGSYTVSPAERDGAGTTLTLHLREVDTENHLLDFTNEWTLRTTLKKYSDFIQYPILLRTERDEVDRDEEGKPKEETRRKTVEWVTVNSMKALWLKPAAEIDEKELKEFYRHLTRDWSDPLDTIFVKAEGTFEYHSVLFVPSQPPMDLYYRDGRFGLRLYSNRVMVMEECRDLLPDWLRFVKGVVDSSDLSLNVSREILQQDRRIASVRKRLVKKVLDALEAMRNSDAEKFAKLWLAFGRLLKEGVVSDHDNRDRLRDLLWFQSTATSHPSAPPPSEDDDEDTEKPLPLVAPTFTTFTSYIERMKPDQEAIFFANGESRAVLERSPHLEGLVSRGYEVLLLTEPYDEIVMSTLAEVNGKKLKSVGKGEVEVGTKEEQEAAKAKIEETTKVHTGLLELIRATLDSFVSEVRLSSRLTRSAACLVGEEGDYSPQFRQLLKRMGQDKMPEVKRVLELNPSHPLLGKMQARFERDANDPYLVRAIEVLHGQALIAEGSPLPDPTEFSLKVAALLADSLDPSTTPTPVPN